MSQPYVTEEQAAMTAVRRASQLASSVFNKLVKAETLTKDDKSPVTIADFAAQAVISTILHNAFPTDLIVGEEDASELRSPNNAEEREMRERIISLANEALTSELMLGDNPTWGIGPGTAKSDSEILDAIDRGNYQGGSQGRMWTIDPIDGTKGFLRGDQYAVCVSLIVDAQVHVGVLGCPNLQKNPEHPEEGNGCMFVAIRGQGTRQMTLSGSNPTFVKIPPTNSPESLFLLESVDPSHSSHSFNSTVSNLLKITQPSVRMDSQAKYGSLARSGGIYMRMPTGAGYKEKIWDHAPGSIIIEEAGGVVSDSRGEPLNFGLGRTLGDNFGVIACGKDTHSGVLTAVQQALQEEKSKA
ncbi:3,5-bisphosphate nucleotidase HAL2 [Crepidotus variabilis]|uniref:3'(2'),5'-bisphosphate nucleotidase n=1 Tax=Crepidotus variabilis TaxID=179855 RepID=A0A9P6JSP0_9AGAR|nr:3,5-bisphosphate nucleotidase HAL2 [Crepidotus variabilis]